VRLTMYDNLWSRSISDGAGHFRRAIDGCGVSPSLAPQASETSPILNEVLEHAVHQRILGRTAILGSD
jgi:hypothetical protein